MFKLYVFATSPSQPISGRGGGRATQGWDSNQKLTYLIFGSSRQFIPRIAVKLQPKPVERDTACCPAQGALSEIPYLAQGLARIFCRGGVRHRGLAAAHPWLRLRKLNSSIFRSRCNLSLAAAARISSEGGGPRCKKPTSS